MLSGHLLISLVTIGLIGGFVHLSGNGTDGRIPRSSVNQFNQVTAKYGKDFQSMSERDNRLAVFHSNLEYLAEHNGKRLTYTVGINQFTDSTFEESSAGFSMQDLNQMTRSTENLFFRKSAKKLV